MSPLGPQPIVLGGPINESQLPASVVSSSGGTGTNLVHQAKGGIAIGEGASVGAGTGNTALGVGALGANTEGTENIAVGGKALIRNTTGVGNVAVGFEALTLNTTAINNVAIGRRALEQNIEGYDNVAIGLGGLFTNTTGAYNVGVGYEAGVNIHTGTRNTIVGSLAVAVGAATSFGTAIGYGTKVGSGSVAIGASNVAASAEAKGENEIQIGVAAHKLAFCGKTPIKPSEAAHTETTAALWSHLEALGLA